MFLLFGIGGVLRQFYIGYGTLAKFLFSIRHMECLIK